MRGLPNLAANGAVQAAAPSVATITDQSGIRSTDLQAGIIGMIPTMGKLKVTVGFHGDQAWCSHKYRYVNIPALPKGTMIPRSIALELYGFAAHETAHLVWTDDAEKQSMMTDDEKKDKLFHHTWNAIEDYMIERNWLLTYAGAEKCFKAVEQRCAAGYLAQWKQNLDIAKDLRIIGPVAITWMRAIDFGLAVNESTQCLQTMPASLQARVAQYFDDIRDVATTGECIEAARIIYADMMANPYDPADPPSNMNLWNQLNQQNQSGGGTGSAGGAPGAGGQGQHTTGPMPAAAHDPISTSATLDAALQELDALDPGQAGNGGFTSMPVTSTSDIGPAAAVLSDEGGRDHYRQAEALLNGVAATTATQLRRSLIARTRSRVRGGRSEGELDHRKIADAVLGVPEVYRKKIAAESYDTAVQIVIDNSGSMGGYLTICQQLAIILHQAFYGTEVKYEIIGYTTGEFKDLPEDAKTMAKAIRSWNKQNGNNDEYDIRAVSIYEFKGFDSMSHAVPVTLGNMPNVPMGGTPTADAIIEAHHRLSKRKEKRHVMFVLTDGAPDDAHACAKAVRAVEGAGVTVIGLGIGCDAVKSCFRDWALLSDANDLPAVVLSKIANTLRRDRGLRGLNKAASYAA